MMTILPFSLEIKLDELPLFRHNGLDETFYGPSVSGTATVEYDHAGDWMVTDISIETENRKCGSSARIRSFFLDAGSALYEAVKCAVEQYCSSLIEEKIAEDVADAGYRRHSVLELVA
jgi:hypothetical protein